MNFFENVLGNAKQVEEDLLGPDYKYWKQINRPSQIGMSSRGSLGAIGDDVEGLIAYVELLVSGGGKASRTGKPLGNKFFLETGATCKDKATGNDVDRYIYINNVPDGSIPFLSSAMGVNFAEFKGLIPGTMSNLGDMNPFAIFQAFMMGSKPDCQELTMETIDVNNNISKESQHVAVADIKNMNSCWFLDKKNPVTGQGCIEEMANIHDTQNILDMPDDILIKIYYGALGMVGLYILYRLIYNRRK